MDDKLEEATAAFARQVVFYEDDRALVREAPSRARISLPSDPSFVSFESAFDNIRGPALPTGTQVARTDGYFDAYLRYPISSENSAFAMDIGLDGGWSGRLKMFVRFITPDGTIRAYELHGGSGLFLLDPGRYRAAWTLGSWALSTFSVASTTCCFCSASSSLSVSPTSAHLSLSSAPLPSRTPSR